MKVDLVVPRSVQCARADRKTGDGFLVKGNRERNGNGHGCIDVQERRPGPEAMATGGPTVREVPHGARRENEPNLQGATSGTRPHDQRHHSLKHRTANIASLVAAFNVTMALAQRARCLLQEPRDFEQSTQCVDSSPAIIAWGP
jgi:hypothetical protein